MNNKKLSRNIVQLSTKFFAITYLKNDIFYLFSNLGMKGSQVYDPDKAVAV